jgi:ribosome-binding protein aMBF1 (putative translation factor)
MRLAHNASNIPALRENGKGFRSPVDSGSKMIQRETMSAKTISPDLALKRSLTESIRRKMAQDNLSISSLAERMKTGRTAVRRILDANNTSITFRSMSRAAQAVGLKVTLVAEPMSPSELGKLAHRLAGSKSRTEANRLSAQITEGFYAGS